MQQVLNLSMGDEESPEVSNVINLQYLNLIHFELYRLTAAVNPDAKIEHQTIGVVDGLLQNAIKPLVVKSIYLPRGQNSITLKPITYHAILQYDPECQSTGFPTYWYKLNKQIYTYPKYTGDVKVVYVAEPTLFTLATTSDEIPYPVIYHRVLIDGTCYYVFQGESGLKNKQELLLSWQRWSNGKKECYAYLMNQSGSGIISTYSPV